MAKKKKSSSSRVPTFYKKTLLALAGIGAILGAYCFYVSKTTCPPVFEGMGYPVKIPGPAADKKTLEIYNHLVEKSKKTSAVRLLPPQEVPEIAASVPPADISCPSFGEKNPPSSATPPAVAPSPAGSGGAQKMSPPAQASPAIAAATKKAPSVQEEKAKQEGPRPPSSSAFRLQVGGMYGSLDQVNQVLSALKKRGACSGGSVPHIQCAKIKGKVVYRIVFAGFKTQKDFIECQNTLKKAGIPHVPLNKS